MSPNSSKDYIYHHCLFAVYNAKRCTIIYTYNSNQVCIYSSFKIHVEKIMIKVLFKVIDLLYCYYGMLQYLEVNTILKCWKCTQTDIQNHFSYFDFWYGKYDWLMQTFCRPYMNTQLSLYVLAISFFILPQYFQLSVVSPLYIC